MQHQNYFCCLFLCFLFFLSTIVTSLTLVSVLSDLQVPLMRINGESMVLLCIYIFSSLCSSFDLCKPGCGPAKHLAYCFKMYVAVKVC